MVPPRCPLVLDREYQPDDEKLMIDIVPLHTTEWELHVVRRASLRSAPSFWGYATWLRRENSLVVV